MHLWTGGLKMKKNIRTEPPMTYFQLGTMLYYSYDEVLPLVLFRTPSRLSTYRPMPKCQQMRGTINVSPKPRVVHNIGVHSQKFHFWSPSAHMVT